MTYPDPYYGNIPGTYNYSGGQSMAFGVDDGIALGTGVAQGLGGILGNDAENQRKNQTHMSAQELLAQIMQWQRQQGLTEGNTAVGLQHDIDKSPLRDQLYFNLSQRMGMPLQSVQYNSTGFAPSAQPTTPNWAQQLNSKMGAYTPGAGGVNTGPQQQLLASLGYGGAQGGPQSLLNQHGPANTKGESLDAYLSNYLKNAMTGGNYNATGQNGGNGTVQYTGGVPATAPTGAAPKPQPRPQTTPAGYPTVGGSGNNPWNINVNPRRV